MRNPIKLMLTLAVTMLLASCAGLPDLETLEHPRYQTGKKQGAAFCGSCHPETHEQWSTMSRHTMATRSLSFHDALREIKENSVLGGLVNEDMCYSCHGDKHSDEGINCESCHGPAPADVPIEVTHEKMYKPRLKEMRKPEFCARCHQVDMPVTGAPLTTLYDEWKQSPAAERGETCQSCHMPKGEDDIFAFHGFRSLVRNPSLYRNKLRLKSIAYDQQRVRLFVENRVTGHSIPASGTTRVLALELRMTDANGNVVHRDAIRFFKHFSMAPLIGGVPFMMMDNTQLRAGEKRMVRFMLPQGAYSRATRLRLILRMYEVADKYEGDIAQAHWQSEPIVKRTFKITHRQASR